MVLSVESVLISPKHMFRVSLVVFLTEITLEREEWVSKWLKQHFANSACSKELFILKCELTTAQLLEHFLQ